MVGVPKGRGGGLFSLELQVSLLYTFSHENLTEHSRSSMGFRRLPWLPQDYVSYYHTIPELSITFHEVP